VSNDPHTRRQILVDRRFQLRYVAGLALAGASVCGAFGVAVWMAVRQAREALAPAGTLLSARGTLEVACGQGALRLLELQPEGKRRMTAAEFLGGHRLRQGDRPFTGGSP